MQIANKAKLIAVLAAMGGPVSMVATPDMLIGTAAAVEVFGSPTVDSVAPDVTDPTSDPVGPSPDSHVLGSRTFNIPYTVDAVGTQPIEVQLFVSRGPTDPWTLIQAKQPNPTESRQFEFTADRDGEYWFATRTTAPKGSAQLSSAVSPQLKVFVDTSKPHAEVVAEADADGRVEVQLIIRDATPLKSMQLRYITDTVRTWHDVDISGLPADGRVGFTPSVAWGQMSLQLIVTDKAGNHNVANRLVQLPRVASVPQYRYAMGPGNGIDARQTPFRVSESDVTDAQTASGPVIALDRPRRHPDASNHAVALGQFPANTPFPSNAPAPSYRNGRSGLGGFRGAAFPVGTPPGVLPAPAPTPMPQAPGPEYIPPPEPSSMYDRLFAPEPAVSNNTRPEPGSGNASPGRTSVQRSPTEIPAPSGQPDLFPLAPSAPIDAPSIYALPTPPGKPDRSSGKLPPPSTPEQISNGFDLSAPANPAVPETVPAPTGSPELFGKSGPQPDDSDDPSQRKPLPQRTLSEALRPLGEKSALPPQREEPAASKPPLTPGESSAYQSKRPSASEIPSIAAGVPVRYSDGLRFSLAYELEAVGSQGVKGIELYGSVDEGKTWKLWGSDPDRTSPFDIETREPGVFGYRIVVVGNNGLTSPRPQFGESPDIVVVVDNQAPEVRVTGARYGEGNRIGALVIQYECSDANLMARPIALSFGPNMDGPWTTIAAGLANDGDYVWPADPQLPRQFYLRIDATDKAGNVGTFILDRPIDAQGLAPRARIRGFQSISGAEPKAAFK
ncbi:hypothetical protein K227x_09600 [Rubripirellula lacrimiformis]|uniref:Ser-Thr-rich glycosyl-phosphatidyl-inositol-anchored membrane family protein n=1 Tax=Rubripirellula lacrimiformis TaxID=1930273 RepID=A0A517N624_9BACT|nr:hypothetical protein [Rubripirellula lacrimiformis]QDT02582.1 hypothetical protein K227x_09600 [Rubripirellula lacrimiformis]